MSASPNTGRIWLVFVGVTVIGLMVFGRILMIQTVEHETWASRGEEFSTSVHHPTRPRPDRVRDEAFATSVPVYDLRWDAKCEGMRWDMYDAQIDTLCIALGSAIGKSPSSLKQIRKRPQPWTSRRLDWTKHSVHFLPGSANAFVKLGRYRAAWCLNVVKTAAVPLASSPRAPWASTANTSASGLSAPGTRARGRRGSNCRAGGGNQWMPVTDDYSWTPWKVWTW